MHEAALIIPALNPSEQLIPYVQDVLAEGFAQVIVVNDGSREACQPIFEHLQLLNRCEVLTHEVNRGKGRALKTAFQYILAQPPHIKRVVTADADGQHTVKDVQRVAEACVEHPEGMVLGVRDFDGPQVPKRSLLGNKATSLLFQWLYGKKLKDTQTGLRGIPVRELSGMIRLKGERYEYEINMLIYAVRKKLEIHEIPIETVYINNNASSHYSSVRDSLRIFQRMISGFPKAHKEEKDSAP